MSDETFTKLKFFVINKIGLEEEEVTREAQLEEDLGITGDDAFELLIEYGKVFQVDVSNFMAADYFGGEAELGISLILQAIFRIKPTRKSLTMAHLEKGIIAGRLDEELINSK